MALVVFLRGVNVGGHRKFQPSVLAKELAHLGMASVGAAGTFVVRAAIGQKALRDELLQRLPFEPELMICPARELIDLARTAPLDEEAIPGDARLFISVMEKQIRTLPRLPLLQPAGKEWQVKIMEVRRRFVVSLWRRRGRALLYPNEVVEKTFRIAATTRNWNTVTAVCDILGNRE